MLTEEGRELFRRYGRQMLDMAKAFLSPADKGVFEAVPVQVFVQPFVDRTAFSRIIRPGCTDQPELAVLLKRHAFPRMENVPVNTVGDDDWPHRLQPHLEQAPKAPLGLNNRDGRQSGIQLEDLIVQISIGATDQGDRSVDTVQHAQAASAGGREKSFCIEPYRIANMDV